MSVVLLAQLVILAYTQHYDDKVDIWSIGALLYKVIVGQCGFHAVSGTPPHFCSLPYVCVCVCLRACRQKDVYIFNA